MTARHPVGLVAAVLVGVLVPAPSATGVPGDPTPPVITATISGTLGANGWYTSNVTVNWRVEDPESTILESSGCDARTLTADTAGSALTCSARTDVWQNSVSVTIKLDKTAPEVTSAAPERAPDSGGWYNRPVTFAFGGTDATSGIESCTSAPYSGPDGESASIAGTCRDRAGNTSSPRAFPLKFDATAPQVTAANADRQPDGDGWFNHPVSFAFVGADSTSGVDSCTSAVYSGPDTKGASVAGTCRDKAGNTSAPRAFPVKYDATPPEVIGAVPKRPPDRRGWYNHAVTFDFQGSDAASGVDSCTSVTYSQPDGKGASISGTCTDKAGNRSAPRSFTLNYDSTPPVVRAVTAAPGNRAAIVRWRLSPDAELVELVRSPGRRAAKMVVYRGKAKSYRDRGLRNGIRYRYAVVSYDEAGNRSRARVAVVVPRGRLYAPRGGARVSRPPLLAWVRVPGADFYNVQILHRGRKVLTAWPSRPRLQLRRAWLYDGRRRRLKPGRYRWYVWPGFRDGSRVRYGRLLGASTFLVTSNR